MRVQRSERGISRCVIAPLCLTIAVLALSGCLSSPVPYKRPPLSLGLAQPCPPLPAPASDSWDDVGEAYVSTILLYGECARKHRAVVDLWNADAQGSD